MPRIKLRWYYTELVEHYFRMAVRYFDVRGTVAKRWLIFTRSWINQLPKEDRCLIEFVFSSKFSNTEDGLTNYAGSIAKEIKRIRLADLEKQFAVESGLISKSESDCIVNYWREVFTYEN